MRAGKQMQNGTDTAYPRKLNLKSAVGIVKNKFNLLHRIP
jgi:hypothetical protein